MFHQLPESPEEKPMRQLRGIGKAPNTFINWKIVSIDIMGELLSSATPVGLGEELAAPTANWFRVNWGILCVSALNTASLTTPVLAVI